MLGPARRTDTDNARDLIDEAPRLTPSLGQVNRGGCTGSGPGGRHCLCATNDVPWFRSVAASPAVMFPAIRPSPASNSIASRRPLNSFQVLYCTTQQRSRQLVRLRRRDSGALDATICTCVTVNWLTAPTSLTDTIPDRLHAFTVLARTLSLFLRLSFTSFAQHSSNTAYVTAT